MSQNLLVWGTMKKCLVSLGQTFNRLSSLRDGKLRVVASEKCPSILNHGWTQINTDIEKDLCLSVLICGNKLSLHGKNDSRNSRVDTAHQSQLFRTWEVSKLQQEIARRSSALVIRT